MSNQNIIWLLICNLGKNKKKEKQYYANSCMVSSIALKSDSTHHFFRNDCTKSGSLRLTDFVCLYTYEFWLSLWKIVRISVTLLLPLFSLLYGYRFFLNICITSCVFYCLFYSKLKCYYFKHILLFKMTKDKTQVKELRQSSPITYISKYTIEHNNI